MTHKPTFPTIPVQDIPDLHGHNSRGSYRPSILVVDDESSIADTLAEILMRSGYAARAAYDGDSALEAALLNPPEMLISDVILPGVSGIDLAITMRRIFPDCKIILFSGQASTADLLAAANREGHQFVLLNKPIHPTDLLARISAGLDTQRATLELIDN
ncbi:MAG TPA: response regulator [Terracidiphilus sp.]|nr:response regulator [Terracidiphilus sp.]